MRITRTAALTLAALLVVAALATGLAAQEPVGMSQAGGLARQNLRPYWHVFAAYTLVIVLVGGWAVTIARRLRGLEDRLRD